MAARQQARPPGVLRTTKGTTRGVEERRGNLNVRVARSTKGGGGEPKNLNEAQTILREVGEREKRNRERDAAFEDAAGRVSRFESDVIKQKAEIVELQEKSNSLNFEIDTLEAFVRGKTKKKV